MEHGKPNRYIHLIRAMLPGDIIYLIAHTPRFDRQVSGSCWREGIKVSTTNVVAVNIDRVTACHLLRIERIS